MTLAMSPGSSLRTELRLQRDVLSQIAGYWSPAMEISLCYYLISRQTGTAEQRKTRKQCRFQTEMRCCLSFGKANYSDERDLHVLLNISPGLGLGPSTAPRGLAICAQRLERAARLMCRAIVCWFLRLFREN